MESCEKLVDKESEKRLFGWDIIGTKHIPYIFRAKEKYCAVRTMRFSNHNSHTWHQELYDCTSVDTYGMTDAEAELLNEINSKHCDCHFGTNPFTSSDVLVKLSDAKEFYNFVSWCCDKLINSHTVPVTRNGFVRINRDSVLPYTIHDHQKYVPLFYIDDITDNLKEKAKKLQGWDLAYLKFCCKVHGIRKQLFDHDSFLVVALSEVVKCFPLGTLFEDYWPAVVKVQMQGQQTSDNQTPKSQPPPMMLIKEFLAKGGVISPDLIWQQQQQAHRRMQSKHFQDAQMPVSFSHSVRETNR